MRYSLLPYFYTLFREASVTGIPVMRPLWLEFPDDKETYNNGDAFMVGPSLLAQGIYEDVSKTAIFSWLRSNFLNNKIIYLLICQSSCRARNQCRSTFLGRSHGMT